MWLAFEGQCRRRGNGGSEAHNTSLLLRHSDGSTSLPPISSTIIPLSPQTKRGAFSAAFRDCAPRSGEQCALAFLSGGIRGIVINVLDDRTNDLCRIDEVPGDFMI